MMHPNVRIGHDALWRKFFNEETGQFYDSEVVSPEQFPTRQEIVENTPPATPRTQ